ncbi:hypothetical protein LR48_Vigan07g161700 [Vigna angularis]|uniref:Uncharacterized protein n=1 Tax=Phaseolus angularis TaxID=3914 RepID=A0A0L9UYQ2_PHAAN|nr:hypothetical protein LR48_Vigan07g161700 [Vigna angularis]
MKNVLLGGGCSKLDACSLQSVTPILSSHAPGISASNRPILDCGGGVSVRGVSRCGGGLCWNVGWQETAVVGCAGTFKVVVVIGAGGGASSQVRMSILQQSFLHPLTHRPRTTAYHHLHTTATGTPTPPHHQRLSDGTKRISKRMWEESERRMWEERELTEVGHPSKANGCPTSVLAFRGHCSARQSRKHQRKRKTNLDAADPLLHPDERPPPPNGYSTNGPPENEKERKGLLKMKKKEREEEK